MFQDLSFGGLFGSTEHAGSGYTYGCLVDVLGIQLWGWEMDVSMSDSSISYSTGFTVFSTSTSTVRGRLI